MFDFVKPGIIRTLQGHSTTIFSIGTKQAGKSFTLLGPDWEESIKRQVQGNGQLSK